MGDKLALVQDDANFLVFIDPESLNVEATTLAVGEAEAQQFDDLRGNKRFKLDLAEFVSLFHHLRREKLD